MFVGIKRPACKPHTPRSTSHTTCVSLSSVLLQIHACLSGFLYQCPSWWTLITTDVHKCTDWDPEISGSAGGGKAWDCPGAVPRSQKVTRSCGPWQGRRPWQQNQSATSEIHSNNALRGHLLRTPAGPCSCPSLEQNKPKPFGCDFSKAPEKACDCELS